MWKAREGDDTAFQFSVPLEIASDTCIATAVITTEERLILNTDWSRHSFSECSVTDATQLASRQAIVGESMRNEVIDAAAESDPISVALCTYNGSRFLGEQLASIAAQTTRPAELVVCDDGSQDGTIGIIEDFAKGVEFPVRVYKNDSNLGSTKNFEKAINLCCGQFIALSDQDDWWVPTKLETLLGALKQHSAGGVFSDGTLMEESSGPTGKTLWKANRFSKEVAEFNAGSRHVAASVLLKQYVVTGATLMFRSDLRQAFTPIPREWVHDGWIAWMIVLHSRLIAVSEPLIHYRVHNAQQLGVTDWSVGGRLSRARERGGEDYRQIEKQFRVLHHYAKSHTNVCDSSLWCRIEAKRRHAQFRSELPDNYIKRWASIASRSAAYKLYAQGWSSMIKDALT